MTSGNQRYETLLAPKAGVQSRLKVISHASQRPTAGSGKLGLTNGNSLKGGLFDHQRDTRRQGLPFIGEKSNGF